MDIDAIEKWRKQVTRNLYENIIPFWMTYSIDRRNGGFYGRISNDLQVDQTAPRSVVLIARILWTFAALFRFDKDTRHLEIAHRAFNYLTRYFSDGKYGGVYWLVAPGGEVLEYKKKIYGQAFAIYGLSEYYAASGEKSALEMANQIFQLIEKYCHDAINGGYYEATNRDWSETQDLRLSAVDLNEKKSMNSHLHLLEALTNLQRVNSDSLVRARLQELVECHLKYILNPVSNHLYLFFDEKWNPRLDAISFGHDIEASWLISEAADVLGDDKIQSQVKSATNKMVAAVVAEGLNQYNALPVDKDLTDNLDSNRFEWWQQAEAVVGLINAYQISGDSSYLDRACRLWDFIDKYFVDWQYGEWYYEVSAEGIPNPDKPKVSEWKCCYHNTRACLEVLKRTAQLINQEENRYAETK
ncbi:MAG TPA: AGE family epimerase/isomerase [Candidatus Marinimicrobia bacterium]|nr:AGE family epimerase/isomerase [Candidatus Neomarinimicrobiota bacterium]HRS51357.1 AGE family epimerase/isomerase [Candidatus Neomarinimicrobiota bacterium]HRU91405.1 AGE family epimerase/isomerase [Candidatus Neomarinimicrobiota bacterium]